MNRRWWYLLKRKKRRQAEVARTQRFDIIHVLLAFFSNFYPVCISYFRADSVVSDAPCVVTPFVDAQSTRKLAKSNNNDEAIHQIKSNFPLLIINRQCLPSISIFNLSFFCPSLYSSFSVVQEGPARIHVQKQTKTSLHSRVNSVLAARGVKPDTKFSTT